MIKWLYDITDIVERIQELIEYNSLTKIRLQDDTERSFSIQRTEPLKFTKTVNRRFEPVYETKLPASTYLDILYSRFK